MRETAVHLAVAGGVFDGIFLCCSFFPLDVLDEIWDVIESVSEGLLTTVFSIHSCVCLVNFRQLLQNQWSHRSH